MLIDITRLVHRSLRRQLPTGIDRVSLAYVERYGERASALVRLGGLWVTFDRRRSQPVFDALTRRAPGSRGALVALLARALTQALARASDATTGVETRPRMLLNVGHSGLEHPRYAHEARRRGLRPVYFVHDLIPISHPALARPGQDQRHLRRMRTVLDSGHALVVNSRCTHEDLARHARRIGRRLPPCVVAPLPPAALPAPRLQPPIDAPYFVVVGTIEPRKNHALLLRVWQQLADDLGAAAPRLLVIGQPGWNSTPIFALLQACPALRRLVTVRQRCDDTELANWLGHARALLFPSVVEGYGMPLVEALALRVPVIASRLPVFREIGGDIPELLDPSDVSAWRGAIVDYMDPAAPRPQRQRSLLNSYVAPGWDAHFAMVDTLVEHCMPGRHQQSLAATASAREWAYASRA